MSTKRLSITQGDLQASYAILGEGSRVFIAFHGFGQSALIFGEMADQIPDSTIIAIDLFGHGSEIPKKRTLPLSSDELASLVKEICSQHQLISIELLGYSIGAKCCLSLLSSTLPITKVWLMAPDGIASQFWYDLVTQNNWIHPLYRWLLIKHRNRFISLLKKLNAIGLMLSSRIKFVQLHLRSNEQVEHIWKVWNFYKHIGIRKEQATADRNPKSIVVILGEFDPVISAKRVLRAMKNIPYPCEAVVLKSGHNLIGREAAAVISGHKKRE